MVRFGKDKKSKNQSYATPGPGNYEIKPKIGVEGKKITISSYKPNNNSANKSPGPGTYEFSVKNRPSTPSYR